MSDALFASPAAFRQAFADGLTGLLEKGGLGPFILVCANATFSHAIYDPAAGGLQHLYAELRAAYAEALEHGREIAAVEEDLLVFLKIQAIGLERLKPTETRQSEGWELQFNHLRSFRPKRITAKVPERLHAPFDEAGFHFNKGFMQKEAFWAGELCGRHATLYYNKYPFVDFHGLLVPERESCLSQYLTEAHHFYLWEVSAALAQNLPGVGFGYNSLGAFASVNHLHFQMFIKPQGFPVMAPKWKHNGGILPYPPSAPPSPTRARPGLTCTSCTNAKRPTTCSTARAACMCSRAASKAPIPSPPGPAVLPGTNWRAASSRSTARITSGWTRRPSKPSWPRWRFSPS